MAFGGGAGTISNPYLIRNSTDFRNITGSYRNKYFKQIQDFYLPDNWYPVHNSTSTAFTGYYDGNDFAIYNLQIEASNIYTYGAWGLFGYTDGATITQLTVGVTNWTETLFSWCSATGVGALVGNANNTLITKCRTSGTIYTNGSYDTQYFGGLVGIANSCNISECFSTIYLRWSGVSAANMHWAGGLIGQCNSSNVSNCYTLGMSYAQLHVAGFVANGTGSTYTNCHSNTTVTSVGSPKWYYYEHAGAFACVEVSGSFSRCYYNEEKANYWDGGRLPEYHATGLSTSEYTNKNNFTSWDFDNTWYMYRHEYPSLLEFMTEIWTPEDLDNVRKNPNRNYDQMANIDLSGFSNWVPIGNLTTPFGGSYDGHGYTISNLTINSPTSDYQGLFGYILRQSDYSSQTLINIRIENTNIVGNNYVGSLAGKVVYITNNNILYPETNITHCYCSTLNINGKDNVGGLIGESSFVVSSCESNGYVNGINNVGGLIGNSLCQQYQSGYNPTTIIGCSSSCIVNGTTSNNSNIGGLFGKFECTFLYNSFSTGNVTGKNHVGGLIGYINGQVNKYSDFNPTDYFNSQITGSYSKGVVVGETHVGGFAGSCNKINILLFCYAWGNVSGNEYVGGFLGSYNFNVTSFSGNKIDNSYSIGKITALTANEDNIGGFIGYCIDSSYIYECFYDSQTSERTDNVNGFPRTTVQMKTRSNYTHWDFNNIWMLEPLVSYPEFYPGWYQYNDFYKNIFKNMYFTTNNKTDTKRIRNMKVLRIINGEHVWRRVRKIKMGEPGAPV